MTIAGEPSSRPAPQPASQAPESEEVEHNVDYSNPPKLGELSKAEKKSLREEYEFFQNTLLNGFAVEGKDPAESAQELIGLMLDRHMVYLGSRREFQGKDEEIARLRTHLNELSASNEAFYNDMMASRNTINSLTTALEVLKDGADGDSTDGDGTISPEKLGAVHDAQSTLINEINLRDENINRLKAEVESKTKAIQQQQASMGMNDGTTSSWAENLQRFMGFLSQENLTLRHQLNEMGKFMNAARIADPARYNQVMQIKQQQQQATQHIPEPRSSARLTYGTVDRSMDDAFEVDSHMTTRPDKHITPSRNRMRRRLAKSKTPPKRLGVSTQRTRPVDWQKTTAIRRAAGTYLQSYEQKTDNDALKPLGRTSGLSKVQSRKRPRLAKVSHIYKVIDALANNKNLPAIPRDLLPQTDRAAITAYDKRNEVTLAKAASLWSLSDDVSQIEKEPVVIPEVRLITVPGTSDYYVPHKPSFKNPRYLPSEPKPIGAEERRHWAKQANKWSLGPERKPLPKKQVRFANKVDFEPSYAGARPRVARRSRQQSGGFNWSALIILLLLMLLAYTNMGPGGFLSWESVNQPPEDLVARMRGPNPGEGTVPIIDFEVAKWSDVDPSVLG